MIQYINRPKDKCHMILSINAEKALSKTQLYTTIETLHKLHMEGTCLKILKVIYEQPTARGKAGVFL